MFMKITDSMNLLIKLTLWNLLCVIHFETSIFVNKLTQNPKIFSHNICFTQCYYENVDVHVSVHNDGISIKQCEDMTNSTLFQEIQDMHPVKVT